MSMRRHRASLFVEQSVFLPGRPEEIKTNLHLIKPVTICLPFTHEKWSSVRRQHHTSWLSSFNVQVIQNIDRHTHVYIYVYCIYFTTQYQI